MQLIPSMAQPTGPVRQPAHQQARQSPRQPASKRAARLWALALIGVLAWGAACAQSMAPRSFPPAVKRGWVQHVEGMVISIDGANKLLSPAANIRDTSNLIIVPTALPPSGAQANYLLDGNGQVQRVWLLTPDEAARPLPKPAGNS